MTFAFVAPADELQIRNLIARYAYAIDGGETEAFASLFLEDGVWTRENAPHLHFHCVVSDSVFDSAPAGGVIFHAAAGLDANAIAQEQAQVRHVVSVRTAWAA
jgi:hypothetical protein